MAANMDSGDEEITAINVTPLVDIFLVLIIILMVTAEFSRYRTIPVQLPKANASVMKREPQKVTVTIKPEGQVYWNDKPVENMQAFSALVKSAKVSNPDLAVIMRAEGKTEYSKVLELLDEVKLAGISRVGLAVDADKK
jgi:biopolymer transport protein ExbD